MAQGMTAGQLEDLGLDSSFLKRLLKDRFMKMTPALFTVEPVGVRLVAGKTHCQPHSFGAFGYFRSKALGKATRPKPRSMSRWLSGF
jgi:hypothetical protein